MKKTDIFIIGGGIHGTAIAADAAGRGLSVALCEKDDLAAGTSSASTKLIHGGLRYLEFYEFSLVKAALKEREILMQKAPHLVRPLEFILPHEKHLRPAWLIRLGLFLYDHLAKKNSLPHSQLIYLPQDPRGEPLLPRFSKGFSYYDCSTDDARLTVSNALAAKEQGALILTRHELVAAKKTGENWQIEIKNSLTHEQIFFEATVLVNAAGPWINHVQKNILPEKLFPIELVKGSHIIVPSLYTGNFAYILQNPDQRIVFTIPYHGFTLIGTTDVIVSDLTNIHITAEEENYLCAVVNRYFKKTIICNDIIASFAGVRCLQKSTEDHPAKITRDYKLILEKEPLPLLTIVSGKLTTHRYVAEIALDLLKPYFSSLKPSNTAKMPLPGGECSDLEKFYLQIKKEFNGLPEELLKRYIANYGTRLTLVLAGAKQLSELGREVAPGLYENEIRYLIEHEWALTVEDIIWRRTKLGLRYSTEDQKKIAEYLSKGGLT